MAILGGIIGGARIGDLAQDLSGNPAPFGGLSLTSTDTAFKNSATSGYVGLTLQSQKRIAKAIVQGSTNQGFTSSGSPTVTLSLYAKTTLPSNGTDGTLLGQTIVTDTTSKVTILSSDNSTLWNYVWVTISVASSTNLLMGFLEFYQAIAPGDFCYTVLDTVLRKDAGGVSPSCEYDDGYISAQVYDSGDNSAPYMAADGISSGLRYCEVKQLTFMDYGGIGVCANTMSLAAQDWETSSVSWFYAFASGDKGHNGSNNNYGTIVGSGDIVGCALNMNIGAVWMSKNGVWQNSATAAEIAAGTTTHAMYSSGLSGKTLRMFGVVGDSNPSGSFAKYHTWNFDPASWTYTAPTGYTAWTHPVTTTSRPRGIVVV